MYQLHLPGEDGLHLGMTTLVLPRPPLFARYWFARELVRDLTLHYQSRNCRDRSCG